MFFCIAGQDQCQGAVACHVAGCAEAVLQGKDAEKYNKEDHGSERRELSVEYFRDSHDEENLCQDRSAKVDIGEERNPEVDHVGAQIFTLVGAFEGDCKCRGGRHSANGSYIGGAVVFDFINSNTVQEC